MNALTLGDMRPSVHSGRRVQIDDRIGTLQWSRNPIYVRLTVEHWYLIISTAKFPRGAALSLQWLPMSSLVVLLVDEIEVAA